MLTVLSMGLGVALVVGVLVVYGVVHQSFNRGGGGYDLIVGAKGGREDLVLNTVFYLSQPVGNIPYSFYEELADGKYGRVETAVPVCMGHSYQGVFRVIGTTPEMFNDLRYGGDQKYQFTQGRNFKKENHFEAVIGSNVAYRTLLSVGEKIQITHGSTGAGELHREKFTVAGVLAPTGTPADRGVFVNMLGFNDLHHSEDAGHEDAKDAKDADAKDADAKDAKHGEHADHHHGEELAEVTAVLVCLPKESADADQMASKINRGRIAQGVVPTRVIAELFEGILGKLQWILLGMAVITVIEAGIGIMVSIYNSMSDRRHEIAVMRALGASRFTVMSIILCESILLSLLGGAMGLAIGHGAIWCFSSKIADMTGVVVGLMQFQLPELILIPGLVVLASAVGFLPAMSAYRTDVAKSLITTP
jgi:putative ABC transport system permease protein